VLKKLKSIGTAFLLFSLLFLEACTNIAINNSAAPSREPIIFEKKSNRLSVNWGQLEQLALNLGMTPENALSEVLATTTEPGLRSDKTFKKLQQFTSNNEIPTQQWYAQKLTGYLLAEDFQCTSPLYQHYFQQRYTIIAGKLTTSCAEKIPFNIISGNGKESVAWLNPNRISAIHLLFAGSDDGLISKFGHVSLRLIVCPEGDFSEAACNKNLYEHAVLGYRAHVNEYSINTIKGLMGGYNAYLYASNFMDVYNQYAVQEFRDLYSLPLLLDQSQRTYMIKSLSEIHWGFSGEYKFLTKNCATLLQEALRLSWTSYANDASFKTNYLRPDNLFSALRNSLFAQSPVFDDLVLAEENGFYFPSTESTYQKAFRVIEYSLAEAGIASLEGYLQEGPAERYERIRDHADFHESLKQDDYLIGALLLLEGYSIQRYEMRMRAGISSFFETHGFDVVQKHLYDHLSPEDYTVFLECVLKPVASHMKPKQSFQGIPRGTSNLVASDTEYSCDLPASQSSVSRINAELSTMDPTQWQAINNAMRAWGNSIDNFIKYKDI